MPSAAELRQKVIDLMGDYGRELNLYQPTIGAYNINTGSVAQAESGGEGTLYEGVGRFGTYSDRLINGTTIRAGDRKVTFVPNNIAYRPMVGDYIEDTTDEVYSVVAFQIREINRELICVTLQVRGGGPPVP